MDTRNLPRWLWGSVGASRRVWEGLSRSCGAVGDGARNSFRESFESDNRPVAF